MIKKGMIMTSALIVSACIFNACASRDSENIDWQITEQSQDSSNQEDNDMEKNTNEPESESMAQWVSIDYNIESYESVQEFGYNLLAQSINDENPVLSPVSAYMALSMAGCGADGTTRDEFYNVLGNDMTALSDDMMDSFPADGDALKLSIANSAWIDDEFTINDAWLGMIHSLMKAEAFHANLSTVETMDNINKWIDDKTNGLIDKMLGEPLDEMTRLALINTVYFKGKWEIPFEASDTRKEEFYLRKEQDEAQQVEMMNLYRTDLDLISNDFAEGVVLQYQSNGDENMAFIAIKPKGNDDIRDTYNKLTVGVMEDMIVNKQTQLVNLKLPKFEVTFDKELNESLKNMGLTDCFDEEKANFDQMGKTHSGDNLYIGLVQQKAKIIVDEEGTEAAAVTEVLMMCGAALESEEPKELYFNEPFIYMIMDMDKEIPLFVGILDNPVL